MLLRWRVRSGAFSPTLPCEPACARRPRRLSLDSHPTGSSTRWSRRWLTSSETTLDRVRPRALIVGRTRYRLPLSPSLARKFDALGMELDVRVLASAAPGSPTGDSMFTLVPQLPFHALDGLVFWL